jgi:anaerobic carbon-monoxide dehydrogenase iron sulfur subunit
MKRVWVDKDKCLGCKTCELQCAVERNSVTKTLAGAVQEEPKPLARVGVFGPTGASFPLQCRHCEDAPCLKACPSGAAQRDPEKGHTFIDQTKCRGCWMCVMSCPFGAVTPCAAFKVAVKCDACAQMEEPACVAACPTGALVYDDEAGYGKVLAKKRGRIAAFVRTGTGSEIVGLDFVREDAK